MDFQTTPDNEYLTHRRTTSLIELGVHRTSMGYQVKCGVIGTPNHDITYNCGGDPEWVNKIYLCVLTILQDRPNSPDSLKGFPMQNVHPISTDRECYVNLFKLKGKAQYPDIRVEVDRINLDNIFDIENMFK